MYQETIERLRRAVDVLPEGLRDHVYRVVDEARRLARVHGIDEERAVVAALGHDLLRAEPPDALLRRAQEAGMAVDDVERAEPVLLHGPLGARLMAAEYGIEDEEVLAAARYHTTARPGMGPLEQLLYVADKIEPEKERREPALRDVRRLADGDLGAAVARLLEVQASQAAERGWALHRETRAALRARG